MGSSDTGTFQIKSWARMRKSLSARAKYEYSKLQIKNKFNQLRTMHTKLKSLCDQSGVGWCAEKGTVTANDTLWEKLYKVTKKAKHFRKKGFPHSAMTQILGDTTATGFNAHPSVHSPSGTDSSDPSFQLKQDKDDGEIEVTNVVVSGKGKKVFDIKALKTTEPKESSKSKKRDSLSENLSASLSALAKSSKRKVDILEAKHNAKSTSVSVTSQDHGEPQGLLAERIKTLNAMEDLDGASYTKGMKLLKDDPSWRPIFLGMSEQRKKDFISYVMEVSNARNDVIADLDNMVFEEGQSSESVNNICKFASHDCIGVIDGTHIDAKVPAREQIPYRGRHKTTSQNVMAACSFDMRFTYVLSGWEGTANDSRVLCECANNPAMEFPMAPLGKYYVVDSGYQNMPGFLMPYKGELYHLSLFRGRRRLPTKEEEWFNYRHSSLRNVIKRCFGALKARFPIVKQMPKGFSV
ncbi:hypothetical protein RHSIM_Rhsim12G0122900 [Rhododendron simsii]|uniref:Myb/SANT-like domain-containing protein n=1 Tax=Rhododendron simsii TaxID=118357 RepID=A0A834G984_RHOSS|nr:hypothetical protein RHSIM_Rhsim12G0122900 [Rhododendron simsii]